MPCSLQDATQALKHIAPLELAEEWDNVGLLIEPSKPRPVRRILLTIDLTDAVLDEAIRLKSELIVAYHPPIFEPIKKLVYTQISSRTHTLQRVIRCIETGISVYSPHTALDSVDGGVNDWLANALGSGERQAIQPHVDWTGTDKTNLHGIVVFTPADHVDGVRRAMSEQGAGLIGSYRECSFNVEGWGTFWGTGESNPVVGEKNRLERVPEVRIEMVCRAHWVPEVLRAIRSAHPYEEPAINVYPLKAIDPVKANAGQGRLFALDPELTIRTIVARVKKHLAIDKVRIAFGVDHTMSTRIGSVAVCAGAGGSVFKNLHNTFGNLWITGEMRHHDVLAANAHGTSVILCDHTHTERGYLPTLKKKLHEKLGRAVRIDVSKSDREPLEIV